MRSCRVNWEVLGLLSHERPTSSRHWHASQLRADQKSPWPQTVRGMDSQEGASSQPWQLHCKKPCHIIHGPFFSLSSGLLLHMFGPIKSPAGGLATLLTGSSDQASCLWTLQGAEGGNSCLGGGMAMQFGHVRSFSVVILPLDFQHPFPRFPAAWVAVFLTSDLSSSLPVYAGCRRGVVSQYSPSIRRDPA